MNLKNHEEIKKGLACCAASIYQCADDCPYREECRSGQGGKAMMEDTLALLQQKEQENAEKAERIRVLESRNNALYHTILGVMHFVDKWLDSPAYDPDEDLKGTAAVARAAHAREIALQAIEQLEAERNAAVDGLKSNCICPECKYFSDDIQEPCRGCKPTASKFEWRGVQKGE